MSTALAIPQQQGPDRIVRRLENELKQARQQIAGQKRRMDEHRGGGGDGGKGKGKGKRKGKRPSATS